MGFVELHSHVCPALDAGVPLARPRSMELLSRARTARLQRPGARRNINAYGCFVPGAQAIDAAYGASQVRSPNVRFTVAGAGRENIGTNGFGPRARQGAAELPAAKSLSSRSTPP